MLGIGGSQEAGRLRQTSSARVPGTYQPWRPPRLKGPMAVPQAAMAVPGRSRIPSCNGATKSGGKVLCDTGSECSGTQVLPCCALDRYDPCVIVKRSLPPG